MLAECTSRWSAAVPGRGESQARIALAQPLRSSSSSRVLGLEQGYSKQTSGGSSRGRLLLEPLKCLKEQLQKSGPDISALNKTLQQQWDQAANMHLGDIVISKFSNRAVWWKCNQCPEGHLHQWQAPIDRRSHGAGCPYCAGRKLCKHNSLATKAPSVAAYWDDAKNGRNANEVIAHSTQKSHWRCSQCKHEWITTPHAKVHHSTACPICHSSKKRGRPQTQHPSFAECQHPLLAEWDHDRNASEGLFPENVTLKSAKQVHWLCNKCPLGQHHLYTAVPYRRTRKKPTGCPFCAGQAACKCNSLQTHFPSIAAEWDYANNSGRPQDYTFASHQKVWWRTAERGSWQQSVHARTDAIQKLVGTRHAREQL